MPRRTEIAGSALIAGISHPGASRAELEIRRAALTADLVAKEADFFSFGTNDLTQTTQQGVGKLMEMCVKAGRQTTPDLEIGICGEPSSVQFCYCINMNYMSCSPYRVPIARLAAAQAAISGDKAETQRTA